MILMVVVRVLMVRFRWLRVIMLISFLRRRVLLLRRVSVILFALYRGRPICHSLGALRVLRLWDVPRRVCQSLPRRPLIRVPDDRVLNSVNFAGPS